MMGSNTNIPMSRFVDVVRGFIDAGNIGYVLYLVYDEMERFCVGGRCMVSY